jgi:hypothetical protein
MVESFMFHVVMAMVRLVLPLASAILFLCGACIGHSLDSGLVGTCNGSTSLLQISSVAPVDPEYRMFASMNEWRSTRDLA